MSRKVRFSRAARIELDQAIAWYEGKQPGLGAQLDSEVDLVLQAAAERPERFAKVTTHVRKARLHKFHYYAIYFMDSAERIDVVAAHHGKRNPNELRQRLDK